MSQHISENYFAFTLKDFNIIREKICGDKESTKTI